MKKNLFEYNDYRSYLRDALPTAGEARGARTKLALELGVQKGFISSILHGNAELSLEQAYRTSVFLSHTEEEREFYLLLVQKDRAGSKDLESHFEKKIKSIALKRREIKERIQVKATLSESDQLTYYSSWHYTAVHMCLRVPTTQTLHSISNYLRLPTKRVSEVLEFFIKTGMAEQKGDTYLVGPTRIHLPSDSPLISKHHTNWRMQAISALDRKSKNNAHYSAIYSISESAAQKIREKLLQLIQDIEPDIRDAKDETVYTLCFDLFNLG